MQIEFVERKSAVLSSSSLACLSDIATINLTAGCEHRCVYCYANGYSHQQGTNKLRIYSNFLDKLQDEIKRKRKLPKCVYFSPSSDVFQPVPEVQKLAFDTLKLLLESGLNVRFLTKGIVPETHFDLLRKYPNQVQAQVGLISCNEKMIDTFEPNTAKPAVRIAQIRRLIAYGIATAVRLDPIIPHFTDDEQTFIDICRSVAESGAKTLSASTLFLRPAIKETLKQRISDKAIYETLVNAFYNAKRQAIRSADSSIIALPIERRLEIFQRLKNVADDYGLSVHLCGCKNQDITATDFSTNCCIAGQGKTELDTGLFCS